DHQPSNQVLIKWPGGKYPQIVDVTRLVSLVAGADFLRKNLRKCEAANIGGSEWQETKIALFDLRQNFYSQGWGLTPADLQFDLTQTALVPVMCIDRTNAPGLPI